MYKKTEYGKHLSNILKKDNASYDEIFDNNIFDFSL